MRKIFLFSSAKFFLTITVLLHCINSFAIVAQNDHPLFANCHETGHCDCSSLVQDFLYLNHNDAIQLHRLEMGPSPQTVEVYWDEAINLCDQEKPSEIPFLCYFIAKNRLINDLHMKKRNPELMFDKANALKLCKGATTIHGPTSCLMEQVSQGNHQMQSKVDPWLNNFLNLDNYIKSCQGK